MAKKSSHVPCAFAVRMSTQPLMDTQHTVLPEVKYTPHHSLQSNDPAGRSWGWRSDGGPESSREWKRNLTLRNRDQGWEAGLEREGLPLTQQLVKSAHRPAMRSLQGVPVSNSCVRIKTTLGQREEISEKTQFCPFQNSVHLFNFHSVNNYPFDHNANTKEKMSERSHVHLLHKKSVSCWKDCTLCTKAVSAREHWWLHRETVWSSFVTQNLLWMCRNPCKAMPASGS